MSLAIGLKGHAQTQVTENWTALTMGSGSLPVFATPALVALLEAAAVAALADHLAEGETSVGVNIQVQHLAATPVGKTVRAEAEITALEGRQITFNLQAWDEHELIGQGVHQRVVVQVERFMARVQGKT